MIFGMLPMVPPIQNVSKIINQAGFSCPRQLVVAPDVLCYFVMFIIETTSETFLNVSHALHLKGVVTKTL